MTQLWAWNSFNFQRSGDIRIWVVRQRFPAAVLLRIPALVTRHFCNFYRFFLNNWFVAHPGRQVPATDAFPTALFPAAQAWPSLRLGDCGTSAVRMEIGQAVPWNVHLSESPQEVLHFLRRFNIQFQWSKRRRSLQLCRPGWVKHRFVGSQLVLFAAYSSSYLVE